VKVLEVKIIEKSNVGLRVRFNVLCDVCRYQGYHIISWLSKEEILEAIDEIENEPCPVCSGEVKAYICSCGKNFSTKQQLKEHKYQEHAY